MIKTHAAILTKLSSPLTIADIEVAAPQSGEVLVKLVATGICHTDLSVINGDFAAPLPIIVGHEGAGVVKAVGEGVHDIKVGDHVVLTPLSHCGKCQYCLQGKPYYCNGINDTSFSGTMPDGTRRFLWKKKKLSHLFCQSSFSNHCVVMASACVKVSKSLPLEKLCPLGCGVSAGAGAVINAAKVRVGDCLAVFGCGGVGLAAILAAKLSGAYEIIAVDLLSKRLELAQALGATTLIKADKEDAVKKIIAKTQGGVDYAFECVGRAETIHQSINCLRSGGTAIITGGVPDATRLELDPNDLLVKNIRGNIAGMSIPQLFIPMLIDYYMQGKFPFDQFCTTYRFRDINQAITDMRQGKVVKPIICY